MLAQRREQRPLEAHLIPADRRQDVGGHLCHGLAARRRARDAREALPLNRGSERFHNFFDGGRDLGPDAVARDEGDGAGLGVADGGDVGDEGAAGLKRE